MVKAIIIDDEKHSVATLAWKLKNFCPEVQVIAQFTDALEALDHLRNAPYPDLIFLDIEMPRLNGFELLDELGGNVPFHVIFITAYDEFGIKAVKANALDYLLKPVQNQELKAALKKVKEKKDTKLEVYFSNDQAPKTRIALPTKESIEFVPPEDIIACSSDSNYTMVFMTGRRKKLISKTLKEVEEWLSGHAFYRAHHSHLVNLNHIKEYIRADGGYLLLSNGEKIPVARNRKEQLLRMI